MALAREVYRALQARGFRDYLYDPTDNDGLDDSKLKAAFSGHDVPKGRSKAEESAYQSGRTWAKLVVEVYGWGELPNIEARLQALAKPDPASVTASMGAPSVSGGFGQPAGGHSIVTAGAQAFYAGAQAYGSAVVNSAESQALAAALGLDDEG